MREIKNVLETEKYKYYIHAGIGLYLLGFQGNHQDIDFRVFHPNIKELYLFLEKQLKTKVSLRRPKNIYHGRYDNHCIEIEDGEFDITTELVTVREGVRFEVPFSEEFFSNITYERYLGISLPVTSLENIFLYYLIHRRGQRMGKKDEKDILEILESGKLNEKKFKSIVDQMKAKTELMQLFSYYKNMLVSFAHVNQRKNPRLG
ncbi:MAG: hypothetical protein Q8P13_04545 [bacterium]|nr:hypothetical protein [bacterium]